MVTVAQKAGEWILHFLQDTAGSLFGAVTSAIIFLYVFVALLTNREKLLTLIRQLNPLGEDVTDLYLSENGLDGARHRERTVRHRALSRRGRSRIRLCRRIPPRLLHISRSC